MSGVYIVFEGGEGSGKSTQSRAIAERLGAVHTREPGGTPTGSLIRQVLLDPSTVVADRAEAFLMVADRAQHFDEVVLPALRAGRHVVADRSSYSTLAYQGYGRGLPVDDLRRLCDWAMQGRWPDLVVALDVPVDVGHTRMGDDPDRMEQAGVDFHERVRQGFLALAADEPERFAVIDATRPLDAVTTAVATAVDAVVAQRAR